ncbi:LysE family translocator [Actinomadura flavalba]|uniref:LysE family translocator n=1 Tax=Actinomadura flavalba TaxID=1120938 RepID=UPI00035D5DCB|nr:LysE family translocator [Actinomadura flavalba]
MVQIDQLLAFSVVAFAIILVPGPNVLFVIGRALAHGRRVALAGVAGSTIGALVLASLVALGVGSIVARSAVVFTVLKLAGAAYLVYLGVQAIRRRRAFAELTQTDAGRGNALGQGVLVSLTNPKLLVFFAAVLPQFVDPARGSSGVQMMVFGAVFCLIALACDGTWGLAAATARTWLARSPQRLALLGGTGGLMMIGLGVTIAATGRKD